MWSIDILVPRSFYVFTSDLPGHVAFMIKPTAVKVINYWSLCDDQPGAKRPGDRCVLHQVVNLSMHRPRKPSVRGCKEFRECYFERYQIVLLMFLTCFCCVVWKYQGIVLATVSLEISLENLLFLEIIVKISHYAKVESVCTSCLDSMSQLVITP